MISVDGRTRVADKSLPMRHANPAGLLAAALALLSGCALSPSRFVADRVDPPPEAAREAAARSAEPLPPAEAAPVPAPAPPAPPAPPRTLGDLVDRALRTDPTTRAAWQDARVAAAEAGSTRSLYLPSLDASLFAGRQQQRGGPDDPIVTQTALDARATITWLLLDLGARGALVDASDQLLVAARFAEHAAIADLVLTVEETYFELLAARALVDAQLATLKQAETSLAAAEGRRQAGVATIADVLQARTALSQVRLALQQTEGQSLALRGALATLAGLPPTAELDVGLLPARVEAERAEPAVEELIARAARLNPDVGQARALAEAAGARARAASRAAWPTLSFQASGGRSIPLLGDADDVTTWSVGLLLRVPVFEGLAPAYDALAARASAEAARARAEGAAQRVALDVWTGFQGVRTAGRRVATARDLVASAEASAEVAAGRYKEGVGSILDLLTAQAALEDARAEDVRARADYLVSLARLARASGRLDLPGAPVAGPEGAR